MGRLFAAGAMRPVLRDGSGHLGDATCPGGAAEARPDQLDRLE